MNHSSKILSGIFFFSLSMISTSVIGRTRVYLNNETNWQFERGKLTRTRIKRNKRKKKVFLIKKIKIKPGKKNGPDAYYYTFVDTGSPAPTSVPIGNMFDDDVLHLSTEAVDYYIYAVGSAGQIEAQL